MKRFFLLLSLLLPVTTQAADRPNLIYILADDLGYGDVEPLNPESTIPTPAFNRLAEEGMTFTDAHSPSSVCTPTRYATLTGRYCWRSQMKRGVLNGYGEPIIETDRPTVASELQKAGYHTGVVGKWHLGLGFQKTDGEWDWSKPVTYSPVDVGFDHSLVIPASLDFPPYVYIKGHRITGLPNRTQEAQGFPGYLRKGELGSDFSIVDCLDELTAKSVEFIHERAGKEDPFFLYMPLTAPHKPVSTHPRFQGKTDLGPYGDFIVQVDWTLGQVLTALDEAGIADNTAVFFTSDNGSFMYRLGEDEPDHLDDETVQGYHEANHHANRPWRGTKADIWEAGHRVPYFVRWPARVKGGSTCDATICHTDFFATAVALAGGELPGPTEGAQDSFDMTPLLDGKTKAFKRAPVVHHSGGGMFAIRQGDWKLILGDGSGGREQPRGKIWGRPWQLFNLASDPGETEDRAASQPDVVADLAAELMKLLAEERSR